MGSFFKIYASKQFKSGMTALRDAAVRFDPETAGEVAIAEMEENFDKANKEFSGAKAEWKKESAQAEAIDTLYEERLTKAGKIQDMIAGGDDRPQLQTALDQTLDALEDMAPDIEQEKQEAVDAKVIMDEMKEVVEMFATKLKSAKRDVKKVANQMKRSERQAQMAKEREERAKMKAGLTAGATGMNSVLDSMNRQAEEARMKAETANRKADMLGPTDVDSILDDVLAVPEEKKSAADRLAALRK